MPPIPGILMSSRTAWNRPLSMRSRACSPLATSVISPRGPIEAIEDTFAIGRRDGVALAFDGDCYFLVDERDGDTDPRIRLGILYGVVHQLGERGGHQLAVGQHRHLITGNGTGENPARFLRT